MPQVWIVNLAGHDYEKAKEWGELRHVTSGYVSPGYLDRLLFDVAKGLKDSAPEDFLLPSGLLVLNIIATAVWISMHGEIRALIWDVKKKEYRRLLIENSHLEHLLSNLKNIEEPNAATGTDE